VVEKQYSEKQAQLMEIPKVFSFNCEQVLTVSIDPEVIPGWHVTIPFKKVLISYNRAYISICMIYHKLNSKL